jgi:hypothetical protein
MSLADAAIDAVAKQVGAAVADRHVALVGRARAPGAVVCARCE